MATLEQDDNPFAEMTDCPDCGNAVGTQENHVCPLVCECTHLLPHEHDEEGNCLGCQRGRYRQGGVVGDWGRLDSERGR